MDLSVSCITREEIIACMARIAPHIRRTPVIEADGGDFGLGACHLVFKLELLQRSGSFKARGAFANLTRHAVAPKGVAAASGGNHGAAVAFAAQRLSIPATIFVPAVSSPAKLARIKDYGADLRITGERYADALAACDDFVAQSGAVSVHAFDQPDTILGQGTLACEIETQAAPIDTLLVSVGGGGLIAGIAAWYGGRVKVVGVEPEAAPTLTAALAAGGPADAPAGGIAADSLAPKRIGQLVYPIVREFVDGAILVSDDAIRSAQRTLWDKLRIVAEPGGAAAFSALLSGVYRPRVDERVGVVISGGNTTAVDFPA